MVTTILGPGIYTQEITTLFTAGKSRTKKERNANRGSCVLP